MVSGLGRPWRRMRSKSVGSESVIAGRISTMGGEGEMKMHTYGDGQALVKVGIGSPLLEEQRRQLDVRWPDRQELSKSFGDLTAISASSSADEQPYHLVTDRSIFHRHDSGHCSGHSLRRRFASQEGLEQGQVSDSDRGQNSGAVVEVHISIVPQQDTDEAFVSAGRLFLDGMLQCGRDACPRNARGQE